MARAVARLGATSARVAGFAGDLGGQASCAELVAAHPDFGIVVNNLGVFGPQDFFDTPDSEWQRFFETNVLSGVRLVNAVLPGPTLSEGVAGMHKAEVERSGNSLEKVAADFVNTHRGSSIIQRARRRRRT